MTRQELDNLVEIINESLNTDTYYILRAYGGNKLVRIVNPSGGVKDVSSGGYITQKELYYYIIGFLNGLDKNKSISSLRHIK